MTSSNNTKNILILREYQKECLDTIFDEYQKGIRCQLVCLPTGSGKTVIFADFPRYFKMKKQMLVLAHRSELLDQACNKIRQANPELNVAVEQAGRVADPSCDVVVASVPTLGRKESKRLRRLDPDRFYLIVVDEAHHATAKTYTRVLEYFGVLEQNTRKLLVGFTATPKRGDGQGLDAVFQEIVFSRSLPEMIHEGFLSPVAGYRVETDIDLSRVKIRMGDFVISQLSQAVNIEKRNNLIVKVYSSLLKEKQTLCFCVDVAHAHSVAHAFNENGINAAAVSGDMDRSQREKALSDFHEKKIQVLANCMVLTEGYDEPGITGIIIARPTKSALLYTQMIGRGTRLHPGKEDVTIVDIVDATRDHTLSTLPTLFGLSEKFNLEGHTTTQVQNAIAWAEQHRPWVDADDATSLSDLRYRCEKINLFDLETPVELEGISKFAWIKTGKGDFRLGLSKGRVVTITSTIIGKWEAVLKDKGKEAPLFQDRTLWKVIKHVEENVRENMPDTVPLIVRNTHWRKASASEKQIKTLERRKINAPKGLTKGQASHLIGMLS